MSPEGNPFDQIMQASLEHIRRLDRDAHQNGLDQTIREARMSRGVGLGLQVLRQRHHLSTAELAAKMSAISPRRKIRWLTVFKVEQGMVPIQELKQDLDYMYRIHAVLPPNFDNGADERI